MRCMIARLRIFGGADDGNVTGARRFHATIGAVMIGHAGLATPLAAAPRRESRPRGGIGKMRLSPIAKALPFGLELTAEMREKIET